MNDLEISLEDLEQRQNILRKALTTIPIRIKTGELSLQAQGIPYAELDQLEGIERIAAHIRSCFSERVMPYTHIRIRFDSQDDTLRTTQMENFLRFPEDCSEEVKKVILKSVGEGGRIEKILIDPLPYLEPGQIQKHPLMAFLDAKYDITHMDLWLSTYHRTGYEAGDYRDGGLAFHSWGNPKLELHLGPNMKKEEEILVRRWFSGFQEERDPLLFKDLGVRDIEK